MAQKKGQGKKKPRKWPRIVLLVAAVVAILLFASTYFFQRSQALSLTEFNDHLAAGQVTAAEFDRQDNVIQVELRNENWPHAVYYPEGLEQTLYEDLTAREGVTVSTAGVSFFGYMRPLLWVTLWAGGLLLLISVIAAVREDSKRKRKPKLSEAERPADRLANVRGIPEIVEYMQRVVGFLKNPERYEAIGARPPKGVLIWGPPGTGKTLVARAVAGEADVDFYSVAGPELMNEWFGGSAKSIRKLFADARASGKAIIFIDEIDAVGRKRRGGGSGGDEERDAALAQLLAEMDGFDPSSNVFVIATTNRPDVLDSALKRPGRFDNQLYVGAPDAGGREDILRLYAAKVKCASDVELAVVAKQSIGFVGADLAQLVNEAALIAAEAGQTEVTQANLHEALEIVSVGPERKGVKFSDSDKQITAYHEAGHALLGLLMPEVPVPLRVTIVPRGQAGGLTRMGVDDEESRYQKRSRAKAELVVLMGGRVAEKLLLKGDFTSGPSHDMHQATELGMNMICQWQMGTYNTSIPLETWMESPHADEVERQVEELLDASEAEATRLLTAHLPALEALAQRLLVAETVEQADLLQYVDVAPLADDALQEVRQRHEAAVQKMQALVLA